MAVVLSFEICQSNDCKTLTFVETTGAYALTNITGWGTPNEDTTAATSATLVITPPSGVVYSIDLFALSDFPKSDTTFEYELDETSLGLTASSKYPDGIYHFTYTVVTDSTTYTQQITQAFYCQVQCCVYSMFKDLDVTCDCSLELKTKAIDAYLLLKGLMYSANCGNTTNFNAELATLQKICLNNECQNCK